MTRKSLTELREEMRAVARGERRASPLPAAPLLAALSGRSKTLAEALHTPGAAEVEFNPPKADWMPKPAEFD